MVAIKPHTVTVRAAIAVVLGDQLEGWEVGEAKPVEGQFTPTNPAVVLREYGVDTTQPHMFLCDVTPTTNGIEQGFSLEVFGETYTVAFVARYRGIGLADHCAIVADRVRG